MLGTDGAGLLRWQETDEVAEPGIHGLLAGKVVVILGVEYKLLASLARVLPNSVFGKWRLT